MRIVCCPHCGEGFELQRKNARKPKIEKERKQNPKRIGPGREIWMAALFRKGRTLQEIGDMYGMTRERVRQLISRQGLKGKDGGRFTLSTPKLIDRQIVRRQKAEQKCIRVYGCGLDEFDRLNFGLSGHAPGSPSLKFSRQRNAAKQRGIPWQMTFFQWISLWNASGKWDQRGIGVGKYCMARKMDTGPYSPDNVYITTCDDNVRDYQASLKVRGVIGADGYARLPENDNLFKEAKP